MSFTSQPDSFPPRWAGSHWSTLTVPLAVPGVPGGDTCSSQRANWSAVTLPGKCTPSAEAADSVIVPPDPADWLVVPPEAAGWLVVPPWPVAAGALCPPQAATPAITVAAPPAARSSSSGPHAAAQPYIPGPGRLRHVSSARNDPPGPAPADQGQGRHVRRHSLIDEY